MFPAIGHPLFYGLRYRQGTSLAQYDKPYASTVPGKCIRGSLHQGVKYVRGEGNGQWAYPGHRFGTGQGQRKHGHLGTEGARRGTGRTLAEGTCYERNGQRGTASQEQRR